MKTSRFRELIAVAIGFILIFSMLLIERIGITYEETKSEVELLLDDRITHMKEAKKIKDCLVLWDSGDATSKKAYKVYNQVLIDMRVAFDVVDLSEEENEDISGCINKYKDIVLAMGNFEVIGEDIDTLTQWVGKGGRLLLGVPPYKGDVFNYISGKLGIISYSDDYAVVEEFVSDKDFMLGAQETYPIIDGYESALCVVLDSKAKVYAHTKEKNVPLIWSRDYKNGRFVVCNFGYAEKAYRGIYSSAYTLLDDVFIYPVINGSVFYIDDFPSPVPAGNGEYVKRDYNMGISEFYSRVWWPDMLKMAKKHDIKYTGLIIETYQDKTSGTLQANNSTSNYYYYGNMLLNQGGELGYHGYNHQPLCLDNFEYKQELGYNTWENYEVMRKSIEELIRFSSGIFPGQKRSVYVPPSDVLSDEGRKMLGTEFPQVKCIASIYLEGKDEYEQEFSVADDGIVETPRIVSGCILDDYMKITAFGELNLHFICSHFMHPDDLLDEDRGADLGWETLKVRLDDYMTWIDESGKDIRHLRGSEIAGAVQRYVNLTPDYQSEDNYIVLSSEGFMDSCYYLVRVNDGKIDDVYGGELVQLNDTLYLLKAQSKRLTMSRSFYE